MHQGALLVVGIGGLGCLWAERSHLRCSQFSDLLLIDADEKTFTGSSEAHCSNDAPRRAAMASLQKCNDH